MYSFGVIHCVILGTIYKHYDVIVLRHCDLKNVYIFLLKHWFHLYVVKMSMSQIELYYQVKLKRFLAYLLH